MVTYSVTYSEVHDSSAQNPFIQKIQLDSATRFGELMQFWQDQNVLFLCQ